MEARKLARSRPSLELQRESMSSLSRRISGSAVGDLPALRHFPAKTFLATKECGMARSISEADRDPSRTDHPEIRLSANARVPRRLHSASTRSRSSVRSFAAASTRSPRITARSSSVRSTIPALATRPPSSISCRVRSRRFTCQVRVSCLASRA